MSELNDLLSGLGLDITGEQVEVPSGGDFTPTGFIAPLMAGMLWTMSSQDDTTQWNGVVDKEEDKIFPTAREAMGSWGFRYYFRKWEAANHAVELIGSEVTRGEKTEKVAPQMVWRFELMRDSIINWASDEARGKWRESLSADVPVKTLQSRKWRYAYHMIALPSAVSAIGRYLGLTDVEYDLSELLDRNTVFDDRFYEINFGHPDENKGVREEFSSYVQSLVESSTVGIDEATATQTAVRDGICKVPYRQSVYWNRRAALWDALGEPDVTVYKPIVRNDVGMPEENQPKYVTSSPKLDACLKIATATWTKPIWCRVQFVNDPKVDETFDTETGTKRRTMPVISEVFRDETAARAAAAADGQGEGTTSASSGSEKPPMPAAYQTSGVPEEMFLQMFAGYVEAGQDDSTIAGKMGITDTESAAWRAHLAV